MDSDRTFPTTTPRWLTEVRTYWAALTTERKYQRKDRSTEDPADEQREPTDAQDTREA